VLKNKRSPISRESGLVINLPSLNCSDVVLGKFKPIAFLKTTIVKYEQSIPSFLYGVPM
jgi:hypothetical protein